MPSPNAPSPSSAADATSALALRVGTGASLQEFQVLLAGGANPFEGEHSPLSFVMRVPSVDQREKVEAFLLLATPEYSLGDELAQQAAVFLQCSGLDSPRLEKLMEQVFVRSRPGAVSLRHSQLEALRSLLASSALAQKDLLRQVSPLLDGLTSLSEKEFIGVVPKESGVPWTALKAVLSRVNLEDRLAVWCEGMAGNTAWAVVLARKQSSQLKRALHWCVHDWCTTACSDQNEAQRVAFAGRLLQAPDSQSKLRVASSHSLSQFPELARMLFPKGDVATAFHRQGTLLWDYIFSSSLSSNGKWGFNQVAQRLALGEWLLEQPQPPFNQLSAEGSCPFNGWECLGEVLDPASADALVERAAALGRELISRGAVDYWGNGEYERATPFKNPILRAVQLSAENYNHSFQRSLTLSSSVPAPTPNGRKPRF